MIAKIIERLNQVFGEAEVVISDELFGMLEDVSHLQCDRLNEALCMFSKFPILW